MASSSFYDFLLNTNMLGEQRGMEQSLDDYNEKAEKAQNRSKLWSTIGKFGLPTLLALTGVGAPAALALAAGGGSLLGSKLGERSAGMPDAKDAVGSGKFFNPDRTKIKKQASQDQKDFHTGQYVNAATDAATSYLMSDLFTDAGGGLKNLLGKITGGGGTSTNVLPQSIMGSLGDGGIGVGANRGTGLLGYLRGASKYQLPNASITPNYFVGFRP
jgi:hypothetical protein